MIYVAIFLVGVAFGAMSKPRKPKAYEVINLRPIG